MTTLTASPCACLCAALACLQLGVINNSTKLVGASSGSFVSTATCAGMSHVQQFAGNLAIAKLCRSKQACAGYLSVAVRRSMALLPADAVQRCNGRLGIVVTEARINTSDVARVLNGGQLGTNAKLVDALVASSYIPVCKQSTRTAAALHAHCMQACIVQLRSAQGRCRCCRFVLRRL